MRTSTNIIDIILNNNYTTAEVALNGFYMIDIVFNSEPYYYAISNKKIIKKTTPAGAFYGYAFYLNGQPVAVGEGGRYHLESDVLIDIYDLKISDDFNISYKASFFKQSDSEIIVHAYPFVPDDDTVLTCIEHFCTPSAGNTNLIDNTYNKVDIEARAGAILEVNNKTIIIKYNTRMRTRERDPRPQRSGRLYGSRSSIGVHLGASQVYIQAPRRCTPKRLVGVHLRGPQVYTYETRTPTPERPCPLWRELMAKPPSN